MALPRAGSRTITVDGTVYRWAVRDNGDHLSAVVEHHDDPAGRLVARIWRGDTADAVSVRPGMVETFIRKAQADGWDPTRASSDFHLR